MRYKIEGHDSYYAGEIVDMVFVLSEREEPPRVGSIVILEGSEEDVLAVVTDSTFVDNSQPYYIMWLTVLSLNEACKSFLMESLS